MSQARDNWCRVCQKFVSDSIAHLNEKHPKAPMADLADLVQHLYDDCDGQATPVAIGQADDA